MAYAARTNVEAVFGVDSVSKWADLENEGVEADIAARIASALSYAEDEVNGRLRGGPYSIPLGEPVESSIVDITAKLAGVWLYESRGVQDIDPETGRPLHKLVWHKKDAEQKMSDILSGKRRLAITDTSKTSVSIPQVVTE